MCIIFLIQFMVSPFTLHLPFTKEHPLCSEILEYNEILRGLSKDLSYESNVLEVVVFVCKR